MYTLAGNINEISESRKIFYFTVWKIQNFTLTREKFRGNTVLCSRILNELVDFTKFLPKNGESRFPQFSHCGKLAEKFLNFHTVSK